MLPLQHLPIEWVKELLKHHSRAIRILAKAEIKRRTNMDTYPYGERTGNPIKRNRL